MSNLILNHPKRGEIENVIKMQGLSYRAKAAFLAEKHGVSLSHSVLAKYHTAHLSGEIDASDAGENETFDGAPVALNIDLESINLLASELNKDENSGNAPLKKELSELLAMQILITKEALANHIAGVGRYPSEYIRNLQVIANLLTK